MGYLRATSDDILGKTGPIPARCDGTRTKVHNRL